MKSRLVSALLAIALAAPLPAQLSQVKTVFVVLLENKNWDQIKGSRAAPYINNVLLPNASRAEQYYNPPNNHPSLPNYLWIEAGTNFSITDDASPLTHHQSTPDHFVAQLTTAGVSWKTYQENIPGNNCPLRNRSPYAPKHNPFIYFDDVTNFNDPSSPTCVEHVRPFTELARDLSANSVARYNFITPNLCDDGHDSCRPIDDPVRQIDTWLSRNIPVILNSAAYKNGGAIFITWDEADHGDGPIGMLVLSPLAKGSGYASRVHYTHGSLLRTLEQIFGVPFLADAKIQPDLGDLFKPAAR